MLPDFREQFPRPGDRFLLEVVAEGPVAEHLEEGVVVGVLADVVEVVVLAAGADALLRVGGPLVGGGLPVPRKYGLNWFMPALVNSSVGSSCGTTRRRGTNVWPCFLTKKSMNCWRIFDDFKNAEICRKVADKCYLPANRLMLDLVRKHEGGSASRSRSPAS